MNIVDKIFFDPITKGLKYFGRNGKSLGSSTDIIYRELPNDVSSVGAATELTDLSITGLEVGATYEYHFTYHVYFSGAAAAFFLLSWGDSATYPALARLENVNVHTASGASRASATLSGFFVASSAAHFKIVAGSSIGTFNAIVGKNGNGPNGLTLAGLLINTSYTGTFLQLRKVV